MSKPVLSKQQGIELAMKATQLLVEPVLLGEGTTGEVLVQLTRVVAATLDTCFAFDGMDVKDPQPLLATLMREARKMMMQLRQQKQEEEKRAIKH